MFYQRAVVIQARYLTHRLSYVIYTTTFCDAAPLQNPPLCNSTPGTTLHTRHTPSPSHCKEDSNYVFPEIKLRCFLSGNFFPRFSVHYLGSAHLKNQMPIIWALIRAFSLAFALFSNCRLQHRHSLCPPRSNDDRMAGQYFGRRQTLDWPLAV